MKRVLTEAILSQGVPTVVERAAEEVVATILVLGIRHYLRTRLIKRPLR